MKLSKKLSLISALLITVSFSFVSCIPVDNSIQTLEPQNNTSVSIQSELNSEIITSENASTNFESFVEDSVTTECSLYDEIDNIISQMSLEEKIYQMFIVTPERLTGFELVTQAGETTAQALESSPVGGIIYFSRNLENENQVTDMISNTQSYAIDDNGIGLFICVDEEGGIISRVADNLETSQKFQSMNTYGENADASEAYNIGCSLAKDISLYGFNVDFAPVADVNLNPANGLDCDGRCFSDDPNKVALMVENIVEGIQDNNVSATLKHFPGLGSANGDTHKGAVYLDRTKDEFINTDFIPFKAGISSGADFVMVSHTIVSDTDDVPCDLSETVVSQWLRNDLNFNGIAITDSHMMGAITDNYSSGEASLMAVKAGIDIVLMPDNIEASFTQIYNAVKNGDITEERINESVRRILLVKSKLGLIKK